MEKLYLSGKISGMEYSESKKLFSEVENRFKGFYEVVNPHVICQKRKEYFDNLEIYHKHHVPESKVWEEYMQICLSELIKCENVMALSNWKESRGARIEIFIAITLGKNVINENGTDFKYDFKLIHSRKKQSYSSVLEYINKLLY